jgi:hypothetical protein
MRPRGGGWTPGTTSSPIRRPTAPSQGMTDTLCCRAAPCAVGRHRSRVSTAASTRGRDEPGAPAGDCWQRVSQHASVWRPRK